VARTFCLAAACLLVAACEPLAISVAGAGASAALGHSLNGVTYRTFTSPLAIVKSATVSALERMGIAVEGMGTFEGGELIYASAINRAIEIELESVSAKTTRMRVAARAGGLFYDSSTATEIVLQTEKQLGADGMTKFTAEPKETKRVSVE